MGDNRGAIEDFTRAIELNSHYGDAYYNRGMTKLSMNQNAAACVDFKKAKELGQIKAKGALIKSCQ